MGAAGTLKGLGGAKDVRDKWQFVMFLFVEQLANWVLESGRNLLAYLAEVGKFESNITGFTSADLNIVHGIYPRKSEKWA